MTSLSVINRRPLTRSCGSCQACCETLAVEELGKPYQTKCVHQGDLGCACYDHRPESCRQFECLWLCGLGHGGQRPDRLGLLWSIRVETSSALIYVDCHELRPGVLAAIPQKEMQALFDAVPKTLPKWALETYAGICLFPYGLEVEAAFPSRPPYGAAPAVSNGMLFSEEAPGCFLYMGPSDGEGKPVYDRGHPGQARRHSLALVGNEPSEG